MCKEYSCRVVVFSLIVIELKYINSYNGYFKAIKELK